MEPFFADLGQAYKKAVKAFADAGCRYLQLDDTSFAHLCDKDRRQLLKDRGEDPDQLMHAYADLINTAISDIPADMTIGMHLCRGNFRSTFISSGGYEPVADVLFNKIKRQRLFPGIRFRPRRRLRAAALPAQARGQICRARDRHLQDRHAGEQGSGQAPHRRGGEIRAARATCACRRNAALPPPKKAMCWPKTSNGRSSP